MSQATECVEAVIISGDRKGQIIHLPFGGEPGLTETDVTALNTALDQLLNAIDRVSAEVRTTIAELAEQPETV